MKKLLIAVIPIALALSSCSGSSASTLESPREVLKIISESELNCSNPQALSNAISGTLLVPNSQTLVCGEEKNSYAVIVLKNKESLTSSYIPLCDVLVKQGDPVDLYWDLEFAVGENWVSYPINFEWSLFEGAEDIVKTLGGEIQSIEFFCNSILDVARSEGVIRDNTDICLAVKGLQTEYENSVLEWRKYLGEFHEERFRETRDKVTSDYVKYIYENFDPKLLDSMLLTVSPDAYESIFETAINEIHSIQRSLQNEQGDWNAIFFLNQESFEETKSNLDNDFLNKIYEPMSGSFACQQTLGDKTLNLKDIVNNFAY